MPQSQKILKVTRSWSLKATKVSFFVTLHVRCGSSGGSALDPGEKQPLHEMLPARDRGKESSRGTHIGITCCSPEGR